MRLLFAAALGIAALPAAAAPAKPHVYTVTIDKLKFGPLPTSLRVGDTILWLNNDIFRHTATARDGSFDVDLQPKAQGRTALTRPGRIVFICKYHPGMTGTLRVTP